MRKCECLCTFVNLFKKLFDPSWQTQRDRIGGVRLGCRRADGEDVPPGGERGFAALADFQRICGPLIAGVETPFYHLSLPLSRLF